MHKRPFPSFERPPGAADSAPPTAEGCDIEPQNVLVEWKREPIGIDTLRPRFRWQLRTVSGRRGSMQSGARVRIVAREGAANPGETVYDSGWVDTRTSAVSPDHDLPLDSLARYEWTLTVRDSRGVHSTESSPHNFVTGVLRPGEWRSSWIAAPTPGARHSSLPLLRTSFEPGPGLRRAYLAIVGLGQYDVTLNGTSVAPGDLASGWSDYRRTVLYDCYDVTALVGPGSTVIGIALGNGFYNVEQTNGRYTKFAGSSQRLTARACLRLIFDDGTDRTVGTGSHWQAGPGPVTFSSIFGGEDQDARLQPVGWSVEAAAPDTFGAAEVVEGPPGRLVANPVAPVGIVDVREAATPSEPSPGVFVFDLGANIAGRPRITLRGAPAGCRVTMTPGELLLPGGTVDQRSATGGEPGYGGIGFVYTAAGEPEESWGPRFTYTGFRYVQVEGLTSAAEVANLSAEVIGATVDRIGDFSCSNPLLTSIHELIVAAVQSNTVSILTDCPHREKLGWLEQYYLNSTTVMYNLDAAALYEKMMADVRDAQLENGMVPSIAPEFVAWVDDQGHDTAFRDSPEWGSAIVLAAWDAYRFTGDLRILEQNYQPMVAFVDYLESRRADGVLNYGLGDWYDRGPQLPGPSQLTSIAYSGTVTLLADLRALSRIAALLGRSRDAEGYAARADDLRALIGERFFDGRDYDRGSQAANAMALALDVPDADDRPAVLQALVDDIAGHGDHVTSGDVGFHYVVRALAENQQSGVLAKVLLEQTAPSYGHQIAQGATTLTEAWDAYGGSSQNHFMLGHAEGWLFGGLGGIRMTFGEPDADLVIAPQPVPGVTWAEVGFRSVLGEIRSSWSRSADAFRLDVTIPAGAAAVVVVPDTDGHDLFESGEPVDRQSGRALNDGRGFALRVGSGQYAFEARRSGEHPELPRYR